MKPQPAPIRPVAEVAGLPLGTVGDPVGVAGAGGDVPQPAASKKASAAEAATPAFPRSLTPANPAQTRPGSKARSAIEDLREATAGQDPREELLERAKET